MSKPGEHKTVQPPSPSELRRSGARILAYAEAEGALLGQFPPSLFSFSGTGRHFSPDIYGNREFVEHLRNRGKFFDHEEKRERDLILIRSASAPWRYPIGHFELAQFAKLRHKRAT